MIKKLSYIDWNIIPNKSDEVDVWLKPCDIVYKINNLYCACETTNECNNLLAFSNIYDISNIKSMLVFVYILGKRENIKYIKICSSIGRYNIFKRIFHDYGAFPPPKENRDVIYYKLDEDCLNSVYEHIKDYDY